ncbi:MAG: molecular chaperone TorD family protein [Phycisphaerae bacterium]|nr:molecular chaperone TorD family protein [Phycisphaerae bacterium]
MAAENNSSSAQATDSALPTALRLLASVFAREADQPLLDQFIARRDELTDVLGRDPLGALTADNALEALAVEYCHLFIGPKGHLPPVESIVLGEGQLWGPSTEAVVEFYERCGIASRSDERTFPDHISMELDCLAMLEETDRHAEAGNFAHLHLLRWLPGLLAHVQANASLAFYPAWLEGLQATLADEYPQTDK